MSAVVEGSRQTAVLKDAVQRINMSDARTGFASRARRKKTRPRSQQQQQQQQRQHYRKARRDSSRSRHKSFTKSWQPEPRVWRQAHQQRSETPARQSSCEVNLSLTPTLSSPRPFDMPACPPDSDVKLQQHLDQIYSSASHLLEIQARAVYK